MDASCLLFTWIVSVCGASYQSENFLVHAADKSSARTIALASETCRRELAERWLGAELPSWRPRAVVHLTTGHPEAYGLAWPAKPDRGYRDHRVWLFGSVTDVCEQVLAHEICHLVLASSGHDLPAWCDEGIASQSDGSRNRSHHGARLASLLQATSGPDLLDRLDRSSLVPSDLDGYALAASLVELTLSRVNHDHPAALRILRRARSPHDLPALLGYQTTRQLEADWRERARRAVAQSSLPKA